MMRTAKKTVRRVCVLSLCLLALTGCTKSSVDNDAPPQAIGAIPADKQGEEDETLAREDNILLDDEPIDTSLFDWEQVKDETDSLFTDNAMYPLGESMEFTADEENMAISLTWIVKDETTADEAMEYAVAMVKQFNDIAAVQKEGLNASNETSFGDLWKDFALTVQVGTKDGKWLVDKSYKAGEAIDLTVSETDGEGPKPEISNGPSKTNK